MLKKVLLISLIVLTPVQAWAVLDMSMQKQLFSVASEGRELVRSHLCHPAEDSPVVGRSMDGDEGLNASGERCYSCTLCMAFGLLPSSASLMPNDRFTQTLHASVKTLAGIDRIVLNKPPIR